MSEHDKTPPREVGQGYPEDAQPGTGVDPRDHAEDDIAPEGDAPATSEKSDGDPSQATGNPRAAGG